MQPPHHHSRINIAELRTQIVRKLGAERSKQYFNYLNRLLSLKLKKVEFNKICLQIVGRENITLHNKFIRSILKNACTAKVTLQAYEVEALKATKAFANIELPNDAYQQNGSQPAINQPPNPAGLSDGNILPLSPRKARTGTRDLGVGDCRCDLAPSGKTSFISQQSLSLQCDDFNVTLENGEPIPHDIQRVVKHHQGLKQQIENETELVGGHPAKLPTVSADDVISVHGKDQTELFVKKDRKEVSARRLLHPPFGIPFCAASAGGSRRALPLTSSSEVTGLFDTNDLLDTMTLKEQMEQIATTQGVEGVSVDCATMLNNGLDAFLKGLIGSSLELVGARSGHVPAILKSCFPISLLDFKVAMELNPQQIGEDWPVLLGTICTHQFDEEM